MSEDCNILSVSMMTHIIFDARMPNRRVQTCMMNPISRNFSKFETSITKNVWECRIVLCHVMCYRQLELCRSLLCHVMCYRQLELCRIVLCHVMCYRQLELCRIVLCHVTCYRQLQFCRSLLYHVTCYRQLQFWSEYRRSTLLRKVQTTYQIRRRHNPE